MQHDMRGRNAKGKENVLSFDASDLQLQPGRFPGMLDMLTDDGLDNYNLVGFSRNAEGEIIVALYTNVKHEILRVFND